ncbi:MAG TPA: hemolysin family protein [Acidimicrobiales bacterium]|nr:hemolysin family protein [Acidimicrobiales bacterium]
MIGGLIAAVLLLVANGFFVAIEFALVATRRDRLEQLSSGDARARAAIASVRELSFMLSAAQLGITLASLALGYVAEPSIARLLEHPLEWVHVPHGLVHPIALVVALTIVVFLHMVVGEMIPKNVAIAEPDRTALWLALPMRGFTFVLRPVIAVLNAMANGGQRLLGVEPRDELVNLATGEELIGMLTASRREGFLDEVEHGLLTGAIGFSERAVSTVMVPRSSVVAVRAGTAVEVVEAAVIESGQSRLPVYERSLDEIVGYVHVKDLLGLPPEARSRPLPRSIVREMLSVAADEPLPNLLVIMRSARLHVAVVVGPDRRTVGIVTLEDLLEALVGDIRDEHDR